MQPVIDLLSKKKVEDIIKDVQKGNTCVIMKPRGVKLLVTGSPFNIMDKRERSINNLDLLCSDLYVKPYMHLNKIKSKLKPDQSYEVVHNYHTGNTFLTSIKKNGQFVNNYGDLFHQAALYDLSIPVVEGLTMENLIKLIHSPGLYFKRLHIREIADSVLLLNSDYQAVITNDHREKNKPATKDYIKLVNSIFDTAPSSLSDDIKVRFEEIFIWTKEVKKHFPTKNIRKLNLPEHTLKVQHFTLSMLPEPLHRFVSSSMINLAIFRTILLILVGKGYNGEIHGDQIKKITSIASHLSWEI